MHDRLSGVWRWPVLSVVYLATTATLSQYIWVQSVGALDRILVGMTEFAVMAAFAYAIWRRMGAAKAGAAAGQPPQLAVQAAVPQVGLGGVAARQPAPGVAARPQPAGQPPGRAALAGRRAALASTPASTSRSGRQRPPCRVAPAPRPNTLRAPRRPTLSAADESTLIPVRHRASRGPTWILPGRGVPPRWAIGDGNGAQATYSVASDRPRRVRGRARAIPRRRHAIHIAPTASPNRRRPSSQPSLRTPTAAARATRRHRALSAGADGGRAGWRRLADHLAAGARLAVAAHARPSRLRRCPRGHEHLAGARLARAGALRRAARRRELCRCRRPGAQSRHSVLSDRRMVTADSSAGAGRRRAARPHLRAAARAPLRRRLQLHPLWPHRRDPPRQSPRSRHPPPSRRSIPRSWSSGATRARCTGRRGCCSPAASRCWRRRSAARWRPTSRSSSCSASPRTSPTPR